MKKQLLFFPDAQPLVERLGREFFRQAPECAGVYLMRDAADVVLYVGKAKNLRRRLNAYRVANPDRLPRRRLRLLRSVARIELEQCPDEMSALARESELLRALRPRFNRAGTWPSPIRFLVWRSLAEQIELAVVEKPEPDWRAVGPMGSGAFHLRAALARVLWLVVCPEQGVVGMPAGWAHGVFTEQAVIRAGARTEEIKVLLEALFLGECERFCAWARAQLPKGTPPFDTAALLADLEFLDRARLAKLGGRDRVEANDSRQFP